MLLQPGVRPAVYLVIIVTGIFDQHGDAVDQLGNQYAHQPIGQRQHHGPGQQNGGGPQQALAVLQLLVPCSLELALAPQKAPLKPLHQRRQQIGHGQTVKHGSQHLGQLAQHMLQRAALIKGVIKHQNGADRQKGRQAPFPIDLALHAAAPPFRGFLLSYSLFRRFARAFHGGIAFFRWLWHNRWTIYFPEVFP